MRNPEFIRNLWLEFKGHRLVVVPLALAAVFLLTVLTDSSNGRFVPVSSMIAAKAGFMLIVILWGSRMAAEAVVQEITARTWDGQRMSAIGPWSMVWGKLFGCTSFAWFSGGLCLLFYAVVAPAKTGAIETAWDILILIQAGLLAHVVALFSSLIALQKGRSPGRSQVTIFQLAGIAAGLLAAQFLPDGVAGDSQINWYGANYDRSDFVFVSIMAYGGWILAGAYQLMRHELQMSSSPLTWLGFLLFSMIYVAGLGIDPDNTGMLWAYISSQRIVVAYLVGLALLYGVALGEPKDRARLRKLREHWRRGERRKTFGMAPRALLTLPVIAAFGVAAMLLEGSPEAKAAYLVPVTFLFALRDVGLIYVINIARPSPRADIAAMIYLLLIYFVVPAIFNALGLDALVVLFRPNGGIATLPGVAAALIEAAIVIAILIRQFRRTLASVEAPVPA